jgi:hypothetical protein
MALHDQIGELEEEIRELNEVTKSQGNVIKEKVSETIKLQHKIRDLEDLVSEFKEEA